MARRRMIEVTVAHDKTFNSLSDFEQLLFLKTLPHTDDYGRFEGDAETLKARVEPLAGRRVSAYETAINNISKSGLWMRYKTDDDKLVIQFKADTFERINAFLVKKKGKPEYKEYKKSYLLISTDIMVITNRKKRVESKEYKAKSKKQRVGSKKQKETDMPESLEKDLTLLAKKFTAFPKPEVAAEAIRKVSP